MYINKHKWTEAIIFWDQKIELNSEIDVFYLLHEFDKKRGENISEHINFKTNLISNNPEVNFSASTRRKWKKLPSTIKYEFCESNIDLENIINEYNYFAKKAMLTKLSHEFLKAVIDDQKLIVTLAYLNHELQYIHIFYVANQIARLWFTFPTKANSNRDINIGLHYFDLVTFKKKGFKTYDWGGGGLKNETNEKKLAIREYKRRFGGEEFSYFKARIPGNKKGENIIKENYKF